MLLQGDKVVKQVCGGSENNGKCSHQKLPRTAGRGRRGERLWPDDVDLSGLRYVLRSCPAAKRRPEDAACFTGQKQEFSKLALLPSAVLGSTEDHQEAESTIP